MNSKNIILFFGWGALLEECYEELVLKIGSTPNFIIDNSESKWGQHFRGILCVPPSILNELQKPQIYITIRSYEAIINQIQKNSVAAIYACIFERCTYKVKQVVPSNNLTIKNNKITKPNTDTFSSKTIFITGASRGLGREIALAFAKFGSNLILHARKKEHLDTTAGECSRLGSKIKLYGADLSNKYEIEKLIESINNENIDILYNNAAYSPPVAEGDFKISTEDFINTYTVNSVAAVMLSNALLPKMINNKYGRIINVSTSVQYKTEAAAYAMSKAALDKYTIDMANKLKNINVSIHLIDPGWLKTDMTGNIGTSSAVSAVNGLLMCALLGNAINGKWIIAQDFSGVSLDRALEKYNIVNDNSKINYVG